MNVILQNLLSGASVKNIILLLDVCYSGGAGNVLSHLQLQLRHDVSIYVVGAARRDRVAMQSSKLKHGIFTDALLKAFWERPTGTNEWLTITQITSSVHNVIQSYQRSEHYDVQPIDITYHVVNPNLPLVKDPRYSFVRKVEQLLELCSYERVEDTRIPQEAPPNFYLTNVKAGLDTLKVGIIPCYNKVEVQEDEGAEETAQFVEKKIEEGYIDLAMMVLAQEASSILHKYDTRRLKIRTIQYIQRNLLSFQKHLRLLQERREKPDPQGNPPLAEIYVPLKAVRHATSPIEVDIEQEVKRWLSDSSPTSTRLVILADYGYGKSTFCQYLAAVMAKEYLDETESAELSSTRIPLLIPLRDLSESPLDFQSYLVDSYLRKVCLIEHANIKALMKMAEVGGLLFIFDGFDEMASKVTVETLKANISQIEQLSRGQSKVLLTTRREYFMDLAEEQDIFQKDQCFYLQPFDESQIQLFLQKHVRFLKANHGEPQYDWADYQQKINGVNRPKLPEILIKTFLDYLREGVVVNRAIIYHLYINKEIDRQLLLSSLHDHVGREKRFEIMEQISLEFYQTDSADLSSQRILDAIGGLLTAEQQQEIEDWLRNIVSRSLLSRKDNTYWFSHESFMEYLLACRLARDITHGKKELFRLKGISKAILNFLLELEEGSVQAANNTENVPFNQVSFQKATLVRWFEDRPQDRTISSNVFSLLVRILPREEIVKLSLQDVNLTGVDLSNVQLQDAQFDGTRLEGANLEGANLERTNLKGANLRGSRLEGTNLKGANLRAAHLERANLRGAQLRGAQLDGANLRDADLEDADLKDASHFGIRSEGANLKGTILEGLI